MGKYGQSEVDVKPSISLNTYIEHKTLSNMICLKLLHFEFVFLFCDIPFPFICMDLYLL